jgi:hypothetical protein
MHMGRPPGRPIAVLSIRAMGAGGRFLIFVGFVTAGAMVGAIRGGMDLAALVGGAGIGAFMGFVFGYLIPH